jgi:transcriptional repressor NrdR
VRCPFCLHPDSRVVDSRVSEEGSAVRRRRECPDCGRRFTTFEHAEETPLFVIKKDGRREPFDRGKLLAGLTRACEKRPISREQIEAVAEEVERGLRDRLSEEVPSRDIGDMVMQRLRRLDEVAYVRFASVYKAFTDADSFVREVRTLVARTKRRAGRKK